MSLLFPRRIILGIVVATLGYSFACAQEEEKTDNQSAVELEKLDALRLSYDLECEDVRQKNWNDPMKKLRAGYKAKMKQLVDKFSKAENLTKALAARNAAKTDPTAETIDSKVPAVAQLQEIFIEARCRIEKKRDEGLVMLAKSHIAKLSVLKGKLTRDQRFESALVVRKEIEIISANVELLAENIKKITTKAKVSPKDLEKPPSDFFSNPKSDFQWEDQGRVIGLIKFLGKGNQVVVPRTIKLKPVVSIAHGAFDSRPNLTSITIPKSVVSIGRWLSRQESGRRSSAQRYFNTFNLCTRLVSINVSAGNPNYTSVNGVLFNKDKTTLLHYPAGKREESFNIPEGVTAIASYAFLGCHSLTSITIPESMMSIGGGFCQDCSQLKTVTILGNAPSQAGSYNTWGKNSPAVIYRKPDTLGWGQTWLGVPVKLIRE